MKRIAGAALIALAATGAKSDPTTGTVARLIGSWEGEGMVRPKGFDTPEPIRCRADGKGMTDVQVSFEGKCATASGSGSFRIFLAQDASGERFVAKVRLTGGERMLDFRGNAAEHAIVLSQKVPVTSGAREIVAELTFSLTDDDAIGMRNRLRDLASGDEAEALSLTFRKRP